MGAGRRNLFRSGLLIMKYIFIILTFFILMLPPVYAQDTEAGSRVSVTITPEVLTAGSPFTLILLVDYPAPENVSVIAPPFPAPLSLERFLRVPRIIDYALQEETARSVQTALEFRLVSAYGGRIALDSFSVETPQGITETGTLILNIRGRTGEPERITVQFSWEEAPRQITQGERVTLVLRTGNTRSVQMPPSSFFMPEVPQGVILSQQPVPPQERESGTVLKLALIPLTAGTFNLPARTLQQGNTQFNIPALNIRINQRP